MFPALWFGMRNKNKESGFTIIELMIVVAVIGILAAVSIPEYLRFQMKSKRTEGVSLIKAIEISQEVYFMKHDTYIPLYDDLVASGELIEFEAKIYQSVNFVSAQHHLGYVIRINGQLDNDIINDELVMKVKDPGPGPWAAFPSGQILVYIDDITS